MIINIPTDKEQERLLENVVTRILDEKLPAIIRKATRKQWLNNKEASKYLGRTTRHLQNLRDTRQINFSQNGKTIRYHIDDLEAYLNKGIVKQRTEGV